MALWLTALHSYDGEFEAGNRSTVHSLEFGSNELRCLFYASAFPHLGQKRILTLGDNIYSKTLITVVMVHPFGILLCYYCNRPSTDFSTLKYGHLFLFVASFRVPLQLELRELQSYKRHIFVNYTSQCYRAKFGT